MGGSDEYNFIVPASLVVEAGLGKGAQPLLYVDGPWALTLRGTPAGSRVIEDEYEGEYEGEHGVHEEAQASAQGYVSLGAEDDLEGGRRRVRGAKITLDEGRYAQLLREQELRGQRGWPRFISELGVSFAPYASRCLADLPRSSHKPQVDHRHVSPSHHDAHRRAHAAPAAHLSEALPRLGRCSLSS